MSRRQRARLRQAAARDLRQWRLSDRADHGLAAVEQFGLGSRCRRSLGRAVHCVAALARSERQAVALERAVDHRHAAGERRRSGAGGGKFKTNEEGRDGKDCAAAADEVSRITPHGLLPTIPVLISRVNPRLGSCVALRFAQARPWRASPNIRLWAKTRIWRARVGRNRSSSSPSSHWVRYVSQPFFDPGTARNQWAPRALGSSRPPISPSPCSAGYLGRSRQIGSATPPPFWQRRFGKGDVRRFRKRARRCASEPLFGCPGSFPISNDNRSKAMNWDRVEGNWKELKGKVQQKWGKLTDDDLNVIEGKRTELSGRLQQRYGVAKDEAERQIDTWLKSVH